MNTNTIVKAKDIVYMVTHLGLRHGHFVPIRGPKYPHIYIIHSEMFFVHKHDTIPFDEHSKISENKMYKLKR